MRLVRAQIDGFGRYVGRSFEFGSGLNVVYGKNEAGKSTLQQFVLAMLYGMKKPGRKRAVYLEEEAKYRPWQGGIYGGILWVEVGGVIYRIERNLRREDEWVRVYREDTGEDLTSRFPLDSRKELSFAQVLWQADRDLFVNTCCIGPIDEEERAGWLLKSAREGDGNQEVLATPDQMKVRLAEEALQKRLESIGSERATTKPLAQRTKKRDELRRSYEDARDREESQKGARISAEEITREYQDAVRDEQTMRKELGIKLARFLNVQEAKIGEKNVQIKQLEETLTKGRRTVEQGLDEGVFQEMQQDFQRLLSAKSQIDSYQKRQIVLAEESREAKALVQQYPNIDESSLLEVERVASRLELVESQATTQPASSETGEDLLSSLDAEHKSQRKKMWIAAAATVLSAPFGLLQWWLSILVFAWFAVGMHYYIQSSRVEQSIKRVREEQEKQKDFQTATHEEQAALEKKLLELLSSFEVDTPRQYRQKWSNVVKAREQAALYEKQVVWLNAELSRAQGERDILARRLLRHLGGEDRPSAALDTEQLREEISRWEGRFEQFRHLRTQIGVWERERERHLYELETEVKELDRWQEIAQHLGIEPEPPSLFAPSPVTASEVETFYDAWREAERLLLERKSRYAEANTRYKTLKEGNKPAAEILLEMERAEMELAKLTLEREALLIAYDVFAEVKEELYRATAPRFASALSEVTERVTMGRYQEVFLDREKSISTISPDSGYTVDLEALSSGTIDQITFALGLSLSGIAIPGGERLPLLLDEPFRRYDDDRLNAVLDLMLEEAQGRQILLFTCREQEAERVLERQEASVRLVELSETSMV